MTHSHGDHYPTFQSVSKRLHSQIKVEYIICSPLNDQNYELNKEEIYFSSDAFRKDVAAFNGAKPVYAHTGMEFTFCNLSQASLI